MRVIRIETPDTSSLGSGMTVALVLCERLMSFPIATKERSRESFWVLVSTYLALLI